MRTLNGNVYLDVADLEKAGISYERIKSARRRGSKGWTFLNDPQDARRLLIKFDDLEPGVRAMVQVAHGTSVSDARLASWCARVCVQSTDVAVLRSHTLPDGSSLPEDVVQRYALACAYYRLVCEVSVRDMRTWGYAGAAEFYAAIQEAATEAKLNLPSNTAALLRKAKAVAKDGPTSVISGKWGNQCARKIGVAQSAWLVAQYSLPTKPDTHKVAVRYNVHALDMGWPTLTEQAIYAHLNAPSVAPLWYMGRHGERAFSNAYAHTMKLRGPAYRDALWCSDGTKLNYFYQGPGGMVAALSVYLVMDVYSEAVLGHSISTSENFKAQFVAAKAALKLSAHKPLQWLYDNQGGHKMRAQQDFFSRAAAMHFPAQPYNAKSKPIESLIGRMQKEVMRDRWYFTGQNITTKSLNSRPNTEFILAHKDRLPSMEEVMYAVREDIARWNSLPHPKTGAPRLDMYMSSVNPQAQPIDFLDMVELFWHTAPKEVVYTNKGLTIEIGGQRLDYEVYTGAGQPDGEFLRKWTNARFVVKYDPEELDSVRLYREENGQLRFVRSAEAKRDYARAVVDLRPGERSEISSNLALRKAQKERIKAELEELRNMSGIDPETLVEVGAFTGQKDATNRAEGRLMAMRNNNEEDDIDPINAL